MYSLMLLQQCGKRESIDYKPREGQKRFPNNLLPLLVTVRMEQCMWLIYQ